MKRLLLVLALALSGCEESKTCSYNADCTCLCQDCDDAGCGTMEKRFYGHACSAAEGVPDCNGWATDQKATVDALCVKDCEAQIGIPSITCSLEPLPANPVSTTSNSTCPLKQ